MFSAREREALIERGGVKITGLKNIGVGKNIEMGSGFDKIVEEELEKPFVSIVKRLAGEAWTPRISRVPLGG